MISIDSKLLNRLHYKTEPFVVADDISVGIKYGSLTVFKYDVIHIHSKLQCFLKI